MKNFQFRKRKILKYFLEIIFNIKAQIFMINKRILNKNFQQKTFKKLFYKTVINSI